MQIQENCQRYEKDDRSHMSREEFDTAQLHGQIDELVKENAGL